MRIGFEYSKAPLAELHDAGQSYVYHEFRRISDPGRVEPGGTHECLRRSECSKAPLAKLYEAGCFHIHHIIRRVLKPGYVELGGRCIEAHRV
jgi:hypothetical protein